MIMATNAGGSEWIVRFNKWMDDTVTPAMGSFSMLVDGVPRALVGVLWDPTMGLRIAHVGLDAITDVVITLDLTDPNLRDTDGGIAQAPQSIRGIV